MKKTIITTVSIAALASAASAQSITVRLTDSALGFSSGDIISFGNVDDFIAGTNATFRENQNVSDGFFRDYGYGNGGGGFALRATDGYLYPVNQYVTWAAGKINDFAFNQHGNSLSVRLTDSALGFSSGDRISFGSVADFIAGTNATLIPFSKTGGTKWG